MLLTGELFLEGRIIGTALVCKQLPQPFYLLGGPPASGHAGVERKDYFLAGKSMSCLSLEDGQAGGREEAQVLPASSGSQQRWNSFCWQQVPAA